MKCSRCNGTGMVKPVPDWGWFVCSDCGGKGKAGMKDMKEFFKTFWAYLTDVPQFLERKETKMRIKLGDKARDTITGFEGTVVALTDWLHGCRRVSIQPSTLHDGKPVEIVSFDEPQVELIESGPERQPTETGGPRPEPKQR